MKQLFITLFLLHTLLNVFAQNELNTENAVFAGGEKLSYLVHYGWVDGAVADLQLTTDTINGKEVFHSVATGRSVGMIAKMYVVKDVYESFFDKETSLPYKAIRNIRESKYRFYNEVFFDHQADTLYSQRSGNHKMEHDLFDVVSSFYHIRKMNLDQFSINDTIILNSWFSDEFYPFIVRYKGIKNVEIDLGEFECHTFQPLVEPGRVFDNEDDMTIYISNDKNRIPIRIQYKIFLGSFNCDLIEFEGLLHEFP